MNMKDEALLLGYAIIALVTIISFISAILKFTQPINQLNIAIQELRDLIAGIKESNEEQNRRLREHGRQIDSLISRVDRLETKVELYHNKNL